MHLIGKLDSLWAVQPQEIYDITTVMMGIVLVACTTYYVASSVDVSEFGLDDAYSFSPLKREFEFPITKF